MVKSEVGASNQQTYAASFNDSLLDMEGKDQKHIPGVPFVYTVCTFAKAVCSRCSL